CPARPGGNRPGWSAEAASPGGVHSGAGPAAAGRARPAGQPAGHVAGRAGRAAGCGPAPVLQRGALLRRLTPKCAPMTPPWQVTRTADHYGVAADTPARRGTRDAGPGLSSCLVRLGPWTPRPASRVPRLPVLLSPSSH